MRRVVSLWLPRFATDRWLRQRALARQPEAGMRRPQSRPERSSTSAMLAEPGRVGQSRVEGEPDEAKRPLALVSDDIGRLVLTAVNEAAAAAGLAPGLPLAEARALVPRLITVPHEPTLDARALAALAAWCTRYTPWAATDSAEDCDGAAGLLLDVTGCCHLFGGERALLEDLQVRLTRFGYTARAALADTPGAAWGMARYATSAAHPCVVVMSGQQRIALAPLPPAALRLPDATLELLRRLGLNRIEDLYPLSPAVLTPRLGALMVRRLAQALGTEAEALSPQQAPAAFLMRQIFVEPVSDPEDLGRAVTLLLEHLCRELARAGRGARQLDLTAYRADGSLQRLTLGTSRPSRDAKHLRHLFTEKLPRLDPGFGIEVMTLGATLTAPLASEQLELSRAKTAPGPAAGAKTLAELVDRLDSRLGSGAVRAPRPVESHVPERAFALLPAGADDGVPGKANDDWRQTPHPKLRPLRLLARPEPVEALSLLPDYPPAQFRWRRVLHHVVRAEGPERLLGEWWHTDPRESEAPPRDYFRVEDQDGRRYWLYRTAGEWYLHGLFG